MSIECFVNVPRYTWLKVQSTFSKQLQIQQRGDHLVEKKPQNSPIAYLITLFEKFYSN